MVSVGCPDKATKDRVKHSLIGTVYMASMCRLKSIGDKIEHAVGKCLPSHITASLRQNRLNSLSS